MTVDKDTLEQIRRRLRVSTRVGDERIEVAARDDDVVLLGAVATPEEVTVAGQLAEVYATVVVNELQVDRGLREGVEEPVDAEPASPADDEVLIGATDMLSGPDHTPTEDMAEAEDENEPWEPPTVPQLAPTAVEQRGGISPRDRELLSEWEERGGEPDDLLDEEERAARERPSAPDLTAVDLERAADGRPLPSLDPTAASPVREPARDPGGVEPDASGGGDDDMVEQVPGTAKGPGAVAESTTGGGALGGTPALETGAVGADTAPTDPARDASGGVQKTAGTDRGPSAREDRAVREDIEEDD
jgi:hypothetical protein